MDKQAIISSLGAGLLGVGGTYMTQQGRIEQQVQDRFEKKVEDRVRKEVTTATAIEALRKDTESNRVKLWEMEGNLNALKGHSHE